MAVVVERLVGDQSREHCLVHLAQFDGEEDKRVGDVGAELLHLHHQALGALVKVICREHELCIFAETCSRGADAFFLDHEPAELGRGDGAGCNSAAVLTGQSFGVPSHGIRVAFDVWIVKARIQSTQVPYHVLRP